MDSFPEGELDLPLNQWADEGYLLAQSIVYDGIKEGENVS